MPKIDIITPTLSAEVKSRLSDKITDTFCRHAGCGRLDVVVRFHEITDENYFTGGQPLNRELNDNMAIELNVHWYKRPNRTPELQDKIAVELTDTVDQEDIFKPALIEVNFGLLTSDTHYENGKRAPA